MRSNTYENHLHDTEARWFAIYTRFQREKVIEQRLSEKGIQAYVPLIKVTREYTRKRRVSLLPLISGYVFTRITKPEYVPVLETKDVVHFVRFSQNIIAIPDNEISLMQRVVGEEVEVEVQQGIFRRGELVEIAYGKLVGLRGRLLDCEGKNFLLELTQIGFSLRIQVSPNMLRKTTMKV